MKLNNSGWGLLVFLLFLFILFMVIVIVAGRLSSI